MKKENEIINIKIILLGDSTVGKTCMLMKYMKKEISEFHVATIAINNYTKEIKIQNSKDKVKMTIYDTSGQERYKSIARNYYKKVDGVILMYDITNKESFDNLEEWIKEIEDNANQNIHIFIVGNKSDLYKERVVKTEDGKSFAENHDCLFFETSIKQNKGVSQLFTTISEKICNSRKLLNYTVIEEEDTKSYKLSKRPPKDENAQKEKKSCCSKNK